jgi:hypothetical protein
MPFDLASYVVGAVLGAGGTFVTLYTGRRRERDVPSRKGECRVLKVLTLEQWLVLKIAPVTKHGRPAPIDGKPSWAVGTMGIIAIEASPDGLACKVEARGIGRTGVTVTADADLGDGVRTISAFVDFEVVAAEAEGFAIEATEPQDLAELARNRRELEDDDEDEPKTGADPVGDPVKDPVNDAPPATGHPLGEGDE